MARTFADGADEKTLRAVYDGLASGVHMKTTGAPSGFKGPRNIAKKASAERVLHFQDADAWTDYNTRYGTGNLREALLMSLDLSAQNPGPKRPPGPTPAPTLTLMT